MTQLSSEQNPDPIEEILLAIKLEGLKYLAREFDIVRSGRKKDIIQRFLTSLIPLRMMLEALRKEELLLICKRLQLSPLPRNRNEIIDKIYNSIIERFDRDDLLECIGKKYNLIRPIGDGGQGTVFLARESLTERVVVIKHAQLPEGVSSLRRELRVLASLDHPNTERLYTYEISEKCPFSLFLVAEYCGDLSLEKALFKDDRISFSDKELALIIGQALSGLAYYHLKQVVHGDISISNISLSPPNEYQKSWGLKFIDFGASRIGFEPVTTPIRNDRYTAPEVPNTPSKMKMCADVFSLSAVIAEILSRKLLFTAIEQKSDFHFIKNWLDIYIQSRNIRELLAKGLHPDPSKRITDGIKLRKEWLPLLDQI